MKMNDYDFSCYVLKYDCESIHGLRYKKDIFKSQDGEKVQLLWNYDYKDPELNLGYAILENKSDGVYAYCYLRKKTTYGMLNNISLGPHVVDCEMENNYIVSGRISSCSLMFSRIDDDEVYHPITNIENSIPEWLYYSPFYTDSVDFEAIEKALGFKLFGYQKSYILQQDFRRMGRTTAEILRILFDKNNYDNPIDYIEQPKDLKEALFRQQFREVWEKLYDARIEMRPVFWTIEDKEKYEKGETK